MKTDEKIILEFTPEEIRLLAYGAVSSDLKERMREVAHFIDDQEETVTTFKERAYEKKNFETQEEKHPVEKRFNCQLCGRSLNHKGNCLMCNLVAKRKGG